MDTGKWIDEGFWNTCMDLGISNLEYGVVQLLNRVNFTRLSYTSLVVSTFYG